ncbi:hypothetical protein MMC29_004318 [Sticta canariensis]|nr:hypothetical protein [Sticta canariensis]
MNPIDPALLYGPFYIDPTSLNTASNTQVADNGTQTSSDWDFDNQTYASEISPINPNNLAQGERGYWDMGIQEFNPDPFNTFGHIDLPSTDGTFGTHDMNSSSIIGSRGTSGQYIGQFIAPNSSSTVGVRGPSTLTSTNVHHEEERTPSAGVGNSGFLPHVIPLRSHHVPLGSSGSTVGRGSLNSRSMDGNLNEERDESHSAGGRPSLKRRRKTGDHDETSASKRLWNFEVSRDISSQQSITSEPSLNNDEFAAAVVLPYDPLWIDRHGLDRSRLHIPRSNLKFEKLFMDNVLLMRDIFVLGDFDEGVQNNLLNTALVVNISKASNWWPDLQIKSTTDASGFRILTRCKGTQDLIKDLVKEDNRLLASKTGAWKTISVYRDGTNLGDLAKVRDEYQFWIAKVDQWAASNNQRRRARRAGREPGMIWRDSAFHRILDDGSTAPLDNQYELNPVFQHHIRNLTSSSNNASS